MDSLFFFIHCLSNTGVRCIVYRFIVFEENACTSFFSCPYARIFACFFEINPYVYSLEVSRMISIYYSSNRLLALEHWSEFQSMRIQFILSRNHTYFYSVHFNGMRYLDIRIFVLGFRFTKEKIIKYYIASVKGKISM